VLNTALQVLNTAARLLQVLKHPLLQPESKKIYWSVKPIANFTGKFDIWLA